VSRIWTQYLNKIMQRIYANYVLNVIALLSEKNRIM